MNFLSKKITTNILGKEMDVEIEVDYKVLSPAFAGNHEEPPEGAEIELAPTCVITFGEEDNQFAEEFDCNDLPEDVTTKLLEAAARDLRDYEGA